MVQGVPLRRLYPVLPILCATMAPWPGQRVTCAGADEALIDEGFEDEIPDLHTYQAVYEADGSRAHSGRFALRITPQGASGGAYFRLDGLIGPDSDYVFSAWVHAGEDGSARLYISASNGERRYTKAAASGGAAGEWVKLAGSLRAEQWRETDSDVMLAMTVTAPGWFDDVTLYATELPDPPMQVYPQLEALLQAEAGGRATRLAPGAPLRLKATSGAFAPDLARLEVARPETESLQIPPDGLLTFAVDVPEPMYVTGSLRLTPDADLRPGLRAYVLCDCTLIAAPMVAAPQWGPLRPQEPVPDLEGAVPPEDVELCAWLLPAGRHFLTVAGPHFRSAGAFQQLHIRPLDRPVETPLVTFAHMADTHLSEARAPWMNVKMGDASAAALRTELQALQSRGADFVLVAGDMVDSATRAQFEQLADVIKDVEIPVYGCVGNHDAYLASSRHELLELLPELFPGGATDYVLTRGPLRFIVLDGSHWLNKEGQFVDHYDSENSGGIGIRPEQLRWLRDTLAADTTTPTILVCHYALYNRRAPSSCGYVTGSCGCRGAAEVLQLVEQAPNVVATLCGHGHWSEVNVREGITHMQIPAFAEWPNAYRLLRAYADRIEWETRQVRNRGFIRESFMTEKAQSWMISTAAGDLAGRIPLD
ncbi:MAG: metallophosphoesterase [Armatimonadota bacterium]